jgi:hypothetical protein
LGGALLQARLWPVLSSQPVALVEAELALTDPRAFLETFVNSSATELKAMQTSMGDMKAKYSSVPSDTRRVIHDWTKPVVTKNKVTDSEIRFCAGLYIATKFHCMQTAASHIEFGYPCRTTSFRIASPVRLTGIKLKRTEYCR